MGQREKQATEHRPAGAQKYCRLFGQHGPFIYNRKEENAKNLPFLHKKWYNKLIWNALFFKALTDFKNGPQIP